ncbi:MAG: tail fiber domain-containing protein, partial [Bacteroidales bacterium]|nr:tail fiber domain-containing protein [Bacteroidales bacterium]
GLALGHNLVVSGAHAVGIGHGSAPNLGDPAFKAAGARSVSMGYDVVNEGTDAVAIGSNLELNTQAGGSVVLGTDHEIEGENNVAIGGEIKAKRPSVSQSSDRNFQMGMSLDVINGSSDAINIGQNMVVDKCGTGTVNIGMDLTTRNLGWGVNIGIGNEVGPDFGGSTSFWGPVVIGHKLVYEEESGVVLGGFNKTELEFWDLPALVVGAGNDRTRKNVLELSEKGALHLLGSEATVFANNVELTSDVRLKTDIRPLDADYSVLQALQPVRYRFTADEKQTLQFGFIAQEVERYFPHLVSTNKKGFKSLNYTGLLPVLWQYTQRLERTVETQAAEIDRLKTELESLKADVQAIKAAMGIGE